MGLRRPFQARTTVGYARTDGMIVGDGSIIGAQVSDPVGDSAAAYLLVRVFFQCTLFCLKIGIEIHVSRDRTFVTEPQRDDIDVNSRL